MDALLLAVLIPALFIVSFCDFYWHLIPNFITLSLVFTGLVVNTLVFGMDGLLNATKGLGIGLVCFIVFYLLGAMGAGDVKLVAGIGALVGGDKIVLVMVCAVFFGGLMAVIQLGITLWQIYVSPLFLPQHGKGEKKMTLRAGLKKTLPYGIAISCGTFITFLIS